MGEVNFSFLSPIFSFYFFSSTEFPSGLPFFTWKRKTDKNKCCHFFFNQILPLFFSPTTFFFTIPSSFLFFRVRNLFSFSFSEILFLFFFCLNVFYCSLPPHVFFFNFFLLFLPFFFWIFYSPPHFFFFKFYKIFHFFFKIFYSESTTFIEGLQLHLVNPWVFKTSFGRGLLEDFWTSRISK